MPRLLLVRHARPVIDPALPAHEWLLDPSGLGAVHDLARSGRLPETGVWFSSPEPKALATAHLLAHAVAPGRAAPDALQDDAQAHRCGCPAVTVVDHLAEHRRQATPWFEDVAEWRALVRSAFATPDRPAYPGWEPLTATRARLLPAVHRILNRHPHDDVVLCGHGTAWTLLVSELTGEPPDHDAWAALRMPDAWEVRRPAVQTGSVSTD